MEDNLKLIQELETLKLRVKHYEEVVQPLANRELQRIRDTEIKAYNLTEEQSKIMQERLATVTTEDEIKATAIQLAGEFRATNKPAYVDPTSVGNGAIYRGNSSVREQLYEGGRDTVKQAYGRHNPARSSIKAEVKPVPVKTEHQRKQNILSRVFGRK
jgi:hypothetical protein